SGQPSRDQLGVKFASVVAWEPPSASPSPLQRSGMFVATFRLAPSPLQRSGMFVATVRLAFPLQRSGMFVATCDQTAYPARY
ncbi:MAG TPA: hypothetical protein VKJ45_03335, partial [Blastocatellia bacterium]|nr:hypothetical protein [Blastocatellia bacterium]